MQDFLIDQVDANEGGFIFPGVSGVGVYVIHPASGEGLPVLHRRAAQGE
ncbi:hypothetical protein SDC9_127123 [bioreactor metagenome]|uniref:Uncharacterized protein n=1 Tax=bioreactor metagenome TaxID=1076179 RepID=A0A645CT23_9ZZZZ